MSIIWYCLGHAIRIVNNTWDTIACPSLFFFRCDYGWRWSVVVLPSLSWLWISQSCSCLHICHCNTDLSFVTFSSLILLLDMGNIPLGILNSKVDSTNLMCQMILFSSNCQKQSRSHIRKKRPLQNTQLSNWHPLICMQFGIFINWSSVFYVQGNVLLI